jgi:hypothetical protein
MMPAMPAPNSPHRLAWAGLALAAAALGFVAVAGLYAETSRVPDQP